MSALNSIDPKRLGHELQLARKARGMTQERAAKELQLARTTLVAIEKGERRLSDAEFEQACRLYGRSQTDFLHTPPSAPSFKSQFRSVGAGATDDPHREEASATLEQLAKNYVRLEQLTGLPLARRFPPVLALSELGTNVEQAADDLASQERNRIGLGDGPVLNLRERLESDVGLRIFYFPMDSRLAGLYGYAEELGACVGINSKHPLERGRWSLAHEFGHFLTTRFSADVDWVTETRGRSLSERFVDHFARSFLMPAAGLNRRVSDSQRGSGGFTLAAVCALANFYEVSIQAMMLRLEELARVKAGTWESISRRGFKPANAKKQLELHARAVRDQRFPPRFCALAVLALERGFVDRVKLGDLIGESDPIGVAAFVDNYRAAVDREANGEFLPLDDLRLSEEIGR